MSHHAAVGGDQTVVRRMSLIEKLTEAAVRAESLTAAADGLTVTIKLRPNGFLVEGTRERDDLLGFGQYLRLVRTVSWIDIEAAHENPLSVAVDHVVAGLPPRADLENAIERANLRGR